MVLDNSEESFVYLKFNTPLGFMIYRQALEEFDIRCYCLGTDKIGMQSKDYNWATKIMKVVCFGNEVHVPDGAILRKQYSDKL